LHFRACFDAIFLLHCHQIFDDEHTQKD
jgi:hypothetical protein